MKWYEFTPSDTLFLRGAEPMTGGVDYETSLVFPPTASVISGAIRTAVLAQRTVSIGEYKSGHAVSQDIGDYGQEAPFTITGPLLRKNTDYFVPAPFSWFSDISVRGRTIGLLKSSRLELDLKKRLGLKSSTNLINWVKHDREVKTLGGSWISLKGLIDGDSKFEKGVSIFMAVDIEKNLFSVEERTGISIDRQRKVEERQLYTARHIRLGDDVSLIWGLDSGCGLEEEGLLALGGEQRFGLYRELAQSPYFPDKGSLFLALSPVSVCRESQNALIGTGGIAYRGGWDLAKQFHKDMCGYYPAGSVFDTNINQVCIPFDD